MFAILFVLLSAAYVLLNPWVPSAPAAFLKAAPILMLAVHAASKAPAGQRIYLALGLLFSLGGDVTLALSPDAFFVHGVGCFLVAHILYIATFRRAMRYSKRAAMLAAAVVCWCAAIGLLLFPHLAALRVPVVAYMVVIMTMGVSAAFASGRHLALFAGAFAFIVSDSVLAVDRFVIHFPYAFHVVMVTYYSGQFLIVDGVVRRRCATTASAARAASASHENRSPTRA